MRLNIAEENSDSQAWEYICILAICIECLQRTTEPIFFLFLLVFKWRACFVTHLQNGFNHPFLPSSLSRPAFPPTSLSEPCFPPCLLPWPASFLPWPLLSPEPSHSHPSSLWALCFSLSCLTCSSPQRRAQSTSSRTDPTILGLSPQAFAEWCVALTHEADFRSCLLSPGICSWAVFCWSDHCVSVYLQSPCTKSVWNWFIFVLHFVTWLVWALSCGLHLQPPLQAENCPGFICLGLWFSSFLNRSLVCLLLAFNVR